VPKGSELVVMTSGGVVEESDQLVPSQRSMRDPP
jgi:hypothetical protein